MSINKKPPKSELFGTFVTPNGFEYETGVVSEEEFNALQSNLQQVDGLKVGDGPYLNDPPNIYTVFSRTADDGEWKVITGRAELGADRTYPYSVGLKSPGPYNYFDHIDNVSKIILCNNYSSIYSYIIWVYGGGPKGYDPDTLFLRFTDDTNDTYKLYLYNHAMDWHYVRYNSDKPAIVKVKWCFGDL